MPAESIRLLHRIGSRDRRFLAAVAVAVAAATPSFVVLTGNGSSTGGDGCVSTVRASVMGAATFTYCGARATELCRTAAAGAGDLAAQCEALRPQPAR